MLTGDRLAAALRTALEELRRCCAAVNALNVFPVADHDTGANLCATLRAAVEAVRASDRAHLGRVAEAAARGAFLGARGSSGTILAEYLYGLSQAWKELPEASAEETRMALGMAARAARAAVQVPVEGTILTVADRAAAASGSDEDVGQLLRQAAAAARATWLRTPEMLPVLRRAGVVDAGAAGLVALLEAMASAALGTPPSPLSPPAPAAGVASVVGSPGSSARYCTEVLLGEAGVSLDRVRRTLGRLGDAVVVAERDGRLRIHLHTQALPSVLRRALRWGKVEEVRAVRLPPDASGEESCAGAWG